MPKVKIFKLNNNGDQEVVVTAELSGDVINFNGDKLFIKRLEDKGILDYKENTNKKLYPKDGKIFMENLKYNFNSGYFNATDIEY